MLREIKDVRQYPGEMLRRWFDDDENFFDLITWVDDAGLVSGFQLSYTVGGFERALTWLGGDFSHRLVDAGDDSPLENNSAVLGDAAAYPFVRLQRRFIASSQEIDDHVREIILQKLEEYSNNQEETPDG